MNGRDATYLMLDLMEKHGLVEKGWSAALHNRKRQLGTCDHRTKTIYLSRHHIEHDSPDDVRDTILHEIAHAFAGPWQGHGPLWKEECRRIGAKPNRCTDSQVSHKLAHKWLGSCTNNACAKTYRRHRLTTSIRNGRCGLCRWPLNWTEQL